MDKSIFEYKALAKNPYDYKYSSAKFYEIGIKDFPLLRIWEMRFESTKVVREDTNQGRDKNL